MLSEKISERARFKRSTSQSYSLSHNKSTNSNETQKPISRSCDHSRCAQAHSIRSLNNFGTVKTRITVTTNHKNGLVDQITSLIFFIFFSLQRKLYAAHINHLESISTCTNKLQYSNQSCSIAKP